MLNPRKIAVEILYNITKKKHSYSDEMSDLRKSDMELSNLDIRFISEIVTGVLRNLEYIDFLVSASSDVKLNKISPYVLSVLRVGVYQIIFMDKVPHSAAVNESVKIIKKSSNYRLAGFVNAVLRKSITNGLVLPNNEDLSTRYSCPEWIVELLSEQFEDVENLLKCMKQKPDIILRTNTCKISTENLIDMLNEEGWICELYNSPIFPEIDYLIRVKKVGTEIESTKAYKEGLFYIQDPAACYVGHILNPKPNSVVLDMCASPGGKTTHFAQKMNDTGKIYAFDVSNSKIIKINQNAKRLGFGSVTAQKSDSSINNPAFNNTADYVVVDAPCSGLGIMRKKPDIKYLRNKDDISNLAKISMSILDASAPYLKKGGTLVFSTCTTTYEENEKVLFDFLNKHKEFKLKKINCTKENDGYMTLYPHLDDCDGFFISLMTKE
jgi:16S rRNA (cytosine967-C5)-methyltransferase